MEKNFDACISYVLKSEGGFVNDPVDPGGATNLGITLNTLKSWRHHAVCVQDVQNLSVVEAKKIYHARYWLPAWCADLPAGLDLLVLDAAVNSGIPPALNTLEKLVGIGIPPRAPQNKHQPSPQKPYHLEATLRDRLSHACMPALITGFCAQRRSFYRSLKTFDHFGKGWLRRVDQTQRAAMHLWVTGPRQSGGR